MKKKKQKPKALNSHFNSPRQIHKALEERAVHQQSAFFVPCNTQKWHQCTLLFSFLTETEPKECRASPSPEMGLQPSGGAVNSNKHIPLTQMEDMGLPLQIKRLHSLQLNGVLIAA